MNKPACALLIVALTSVMVVSPAHGGARFNFVLGAKLLDDDWEDPSLIGRVPATQGYPTGADLSEHLELGVLATFGPDRWPVAIAVDLLVSLEEDEVTVVDFPAEEVHPIDLEATTFELDLGVRKFWNRGDQKRMQPFLGGGLGLISAERTEEDAQDVTLSVDDEALGVWADGGMIWRVTSHFSVGFEIRVSRGEVTLFGEDVEAGGEQIGVIFGW